jgi:hypothetical protein
MFDTGEFHQPEKAQNADRSGKAFRKFCRLTNSGTNSFSDIEVISVR